jgi:4-amino-4-deoxy-L-arabinose transferase-like glycosyltransferase
MKAHFPTARPALLIAAMTVLALLVRLFYVRTAIVDHPLRGDAVQYFAYALNLVDHHIFSIVSPDGIAKPDSFRDPGYPLFLALMVKLFGRGQPFYLAVLDAQCVLSALTVGMYAWLARRWLGTAAAVAAGSCLALWPHLITLSGYVLSETVLGFLFASGLCALQLASDRHSRSWATVAGLAFAAAALTNAVVLPLAPLFAAIAAWRDSTRRTLWLAFLFAATLPCAAWMIRGAMLPSSLAASDRIAMNFAQGSWPEYHRAWYKALELDDAESKAVLADIDSDVRRLSSQPTAALGAIAKRFADQPARYLAWYASKPAELWGWTIGIGAGDIYVFPTSNSPLSGHGVLRATTDLIYLINPLVTLLAMIGTAATACKPRHREPALLFAAAGVIFVTAVYGILQSDARYAVPYRGAECLMAALGVKSLYHIGRRVRRTTSSISTNGANDAQAR